MHLLGAARNGGPVSDRAVHRTRVEQGGTDGRSRGGEGKRLAPNPLHGLFVWRMPRANRPTRCLGCCCVMDSNTNRDLGNAPRKQAMYSIQQAMPIPVQI